MNVFLSQLNRSDAFELKRWVLACLTVIFRDFINYSRECINLILRPAWQMLNQSLKTFTDVLVHRVTKIQVKLDSDFECDEPSGVRGMILSLIELLTTLVQRPNVQEVVRQGLQPLMVTVAHYCLVE